MDHKTDTDKCDLDELGFYLEERGSVWVVQFAEGGCRPATIPEKVMWDARQAARASLAASAGSEPFAWCQPDDSNAGEAFSWPGTDKRAHHTTPLFTHPSPPEGAGWISVDERLPEPNVEVLCTGQGWGQPFVTACYYDDERREWYPINTHWTDSIGSAQYPTHWRELPPAPPLASEAKGASHGL